MGNFIKSIISYTVIVGVPIVCIGAISVAAYSTGHNEGKVEGLRTAETLLKSHIKHKDEENEE